MRLALRCVRLVGKLKRRLHLVLAGHARQGRAMILDRQTSRVCAGRFTLLERDIEKYLVKRVKELGGVAYKFVSPSNRGVADRLVVLPQGVVWFVEVKKAGGRLSTLQNIFAAEMQRLQQNIAIVWSKEDVDDLIKEMQS
jgi:hypothetical protein